MPRRNQTGPDGIGPMTGRRLGSCSGANRKNNFRGIRDGFGLGRKLGFGGGYRYGNIFNTDAANTDDKSFIENDIKYLKEQLKLREKDLKNIHEK